MAKIPTVPPTISHEHEKPKWLTPGVWGIGLASFLADVGHEVPTALFASFVTVTLGAPAAILGLIEGLADGLAELPDSQGEHSPTTRRRDVPSHLEDIFLRPPSQHSLGWQAPCGKLLCYVWSVDSAWSACSCTQCTSCRYSSKRSVWTRLRL